MGSLRKVYGRVHRAFIQAVNRLGWVVAPVSDYYHALRPVAELERHASRWYRPSRMAGVSFDLAAMTAELEGMAAAYLPEYSELPSYEEIKRQRRGPGFTTVDSM